MFFPYQVSVRYSITNLFSLNSMIKVCSAKCLDKTYREGELSKGEAVCLDRCAAKFFEAHQIISDQLQKEGAARGFGGGM